MNELLCPLAQDPDWIIDTDSSGTPGIYKTKEYSKSGKAIQRAQTAIDENCTYCPLMAVCAPKASTIYSGGHRPFVKTNLTVGELRGREPLPSADAAAASSPTGEAT